MATVEFDRATVRIDGKTILREVSLSIGQGGFVGLIGPSGSGKTTILRAIAGLADIAAGSLRLDGVDVSRARAGDRDVGMVFQEPALFNHRTVERNVAFPLEIRRQHANEIRQRVGAEARAMHLEHLLDRHPDQLSRGEAQLVQIARSMVRMPGVLLLDEPLASLDEPTKARMRSELTMLQAGYGVTTVMSTNDPHDAVMMPSALAVIHDRTVVQVGTPEAVRSAPHNLDAAMATGDCYTISATVERDVDGYWLVNPGDADSTAFRYRAWSGALDEYVGRQVTVGIRPSDVRLHDAGSVSARVTRAIPGQPVGVMCDVAGHRFGVGSGGDVSVGDAVRLQIDRVMVFDPESTRAIA